MRQRAVEALGAASALAMAILINTTIEIRLRAVRAIFTELLSRTEAGWSSQRQCTSVVAGKPCALMPIGINTHGLPEMV